MSYSNGQPTGCNGMRHPAYLAASTLLSWLIELCSPPPNSWSFGWVDAQAPKFETPAGVSTCIPEVVVDAQVGTGTAMVNLTPPTAHDNNDENVEVTSTSPHSSIFPLGDTAVVYTATDKAGHNATCTTTVKVIGTCFVRPCTLLILT